MARRKIAPLFQQSSILILMRRVSHMRKKPGNALEKQFFPG
jgi:hypothetical protein